MKLTLFKTQSHTVVAGVRVCPFLTSTLGGVEWSTTSCPDRFKHSTHSTGSWVGLESVWRIWRVKESLTLAKIRNPDSPALIQSLCCRRYSSSRPRIDEIKLNSVNNQRYWWRTPYLLFHWRLGEFVNIANDVKEKKCIREVAGSKLGKDVGYPDWITSPLGKWPDSRPHFN
jgi:hypothetical protein